MYPMLLCNTILINAIITIYMYICIYFIAKKIVSLLFTGLVDPTNQYIKLAVDYRIITLFFLFSGVWACTCGLQNTNLFFQLSGECVWGEGGVLSFSLYSLWVLSSYSSKNQFTNFTNNWTHVHFPVGEKGCLFRTGNCPVPMTENWDLCFCKNRPDKNSSVQSHVVSVGLENVIFWCLNQNWIQLASFLFSYSTFI